MCELSAEGENCYEKIICGITLLVSFSMLSGCGSSKDDLFSYRSSEKDNNDSKNDMSTSESSDESYYDYDVDNVETRDGYTSVDKAFEAYAEAILSCDAEKLMMLIPESCKEYCEDAFFLTESQLQEKLQKAMNDRCEWDVNKYSYEKTGETEVSGELYSETVVSGGGDVVESGYWVNFEATSDKNGEKVSINLDSAGDDDYVEFFEQDGRWYSYSAFFSIFRVAAGGSSLTGKVYSEEY